MRLLVLGGTAFVGRHLVDDALARGHELTLLHRGRTNPDLFADRGARHVHADRDGGLDALPAGTWDAVVDTSGYVPRVVGQAAEALAERVERYAFISSISVYDDVGSGEGPDEDHPVSALDDPTDETVDGRTYGPLKALCEDAVRQAVGERALIVRPGLIVGPYDPTDRFTYWPVRAARGGPFVAPGTPGVPTQLIDARDLAAWLLDVLERGQGGTYNATGPMLPLTMGTVMDTAIATAGTDAEPVWLDEATLLAAKVAPFTEMPLWVPAAGRAMMRVNASRAIAQGLSFRPLSETMSDTLAWWRSLPESGRTLRAGLDAEREQELLREAAEGAS